MAELLIQFLALAFLTACSSPPSPPAELVFRGGAIYTLNAEAPWADGLAIADGRILAIGKVEAFIGEDTHVIDLDGRLLLPGFHDDRVDLAAGAAWLEEAGITPSDAPTYLHRFGITSVRALDDTLPEGLPLRTHNLRSKDRGGERFGSGWPETTIDPLVGLHRAVTGLDLDGRRVTIEKLNVEDAVPRYAATRLEPGELADLAVLSENILKIPPERIAKCKVEMTLFGGRIVYQADSFDQGEPSTLERPIRQRGYDENIFFLLLPALLSAAQGPNPEMMQKMMEARFHLNGIFDKDIEARVPVGDLGLPEKAVARFDANGDGYVIFDEYTKMIQRSASGPACT